VAADLVAFLRARLDEDEAYLLSNRRHLWTQRPLREVEAKRAILDAFQAVDAEVVTMLHDRRPRKYGEWDGLHKAVCHLATVYRDHPDYDEAWKP